MKWLILIFVLIIAGCGGSDSGPINHSVVNYQLDQNGCLIQCNNISDSFSFTSGSYYSFDCTWHCAQYGNNDNVYVNLSFDNGNSGSSCLKLSSEFISDGICIYE